MGTLIAGWIDAAASLLAAVLFFRFYSTATMARFYKKRWVMVVCGFLLLYSLIGIINAYRKYIQGRPPTRGELQEAMAANNALVTQDVVFTSPDGYTLVLPAGYAYTTYSSGPISLTAIKKHSQASAQSAIVVARQQGRGELASLIHETLQALKGKNSTYAFSSEASFSIGEKKAMRVTVDVEKEGVPVKGIFVFTKAGTTIYEFMMSCPASLFSQEFSEFEKVIRSVRLQ
ncbi:MAG TPA: hypothetical protein VEH53_07415 [archaeon]|nr:hypothetical protein [archaeon]